MFYKMQLTTAIYCLTLIQSLFDQPLAVKPCDVYISLFKSHSCYVKLNQVEHAGSPFEISAYMCSIQFNSIQWTHSATRGLKYMCYDVICTV